MVQMISTVQHYSVRLQCTRYSDFLSTVSPVLCTVSPLQCLILIIYFRSNSSVCKARVLFIGALPTARHRISVPVGAHARWDLRRYFIGKDLPHAVNQPYRTARNRVPRVTTSIQALFSTRDITLQWLNFFFSKNLVKLFSIKKTCSGSGPAGVVGIVPISICTSTRY
jgi:hypothetical protein